MKLKSLLLTITATLGMYAVTKAQVPNYVPTDGLVGWWPFNGNANDESGNGNNGTVNGATLSQDRFGNEKSSYSFNGTNNFIYIPDNNSLDLTNQFTLSCWINIPDYSVNPSLVNANGDKDVQRTIFGKPKNSGWATGYNLANRPNGISSTLASNAANMSCCPNTSVKSNTSPNLNTWYFLVAIYDGSTFSLYINGSLESSIQTAFVLDNSAEPLYIGKEFTNVNNNWYRWFKGLIDDIGIWNRALTEKEVINLYNASICSNDLFITAQNNTLQTGGNVTFTATTSDANASYIWQSDLGQGYQTLNNYGNYSGTNSENLNISNLQLSNHNQAIRAISTTEECTDTSNVATIKLTDTCISLISVTDTLIINAQITNTNLPVKINTLKVFPNPASSQITIDYGNFNEMSGYTLTIVNSLGQSVFSTPINQQTSTIDISSLSGKGFYFIRVIDPQNNTIENRKLIIE
jgi:hypothetical protein